MLRVNKAHLCPICQKADWCLYSEDGSAAICARVSEGSRKKSGDAGWLHVLTEDAGKRFDGRSRRPQRSGPKRYDGPKVDFVKLARDYRQRISRRQIYMLAKTLGVTAASLVRLGVGWDGEAFCFAMCDESGGVIGIRRRFGDGRKFCVKGSSNGLFIPEGIDGSGPLMVCEGPTDTAVALDMGFAAVGRPNCNSKVRMTARYVGARQVTIIADNDAAGIDGAKRLAQELAVRSGNVRIIVPPLGVKDLRDWNSKGLTRRRLRYGA